MKIEEINITNATIQSLQRQLERAEREQKFWSQARLIALRGGTIDDIMAIGEDVDKALAEACLNPHSIMYQTESQNVCAKKVNFLKAKLKRAIDDEKARMTKRGILNSEEQHDRTK